MPFLALLLVLLLPVIALLLMPFTLVQRYRMGSARRRARGWLAALNVFAMAFSNALFLLGAAFTSYWIAGVFTQALLGVAAGGALGVVGFLLTRWEHEQGALHYTPNRWLVLAITLVVAARVGLRLLARSARVVLRRGAVDSRRRGDARGRWPRARLLLRLLARRAPQPPRVGAHSRSPSRGASVNDG